MVSFFLLQVQLTLTNLTQRPRISDRGHHDGLPGFEAADLDESDFEEEEELLPAEIAYMKRNEHEDLHHPVDPNSRGAALKTSSGEIACACTGFGGNCHGSCRWEQQEEEEEEGDEDEDEEDEDLPVFDLVGRKANSAFWIVSKSQSESG